MMDNKPLIGEEEDQSLERYEAKLRELYNQMIRVAYAKVINKSDAQDAVQEAWVRMLANQDTLRERSKLQAWAKTITANVAHNMNRQVQRTQPCSWCGEEENEAVNPYMSEVDVMLEISELLGKLDARSRTLMLYKFYYGFKDQEIAASLQLPVGTVKARIHRTKAQLRRILIEQLNI